MNKLNERSAQLNEFIIVSIDTLFTKPHGIVL